MRKIDREQLKRMSYQECADLAEEARREILSCVSENGGHLASNLGLVEATIALHRSFDCAQDSVIFDVGHQCYTHKLLTGRSLARLRRQDGVSGFTNPSESACDVSFEGHSGTSVSRALGVATANLLAGNERYTVAVVGDGSLTNGMIYEALNNCSERRNLRMLIVLNDNVMSISKNVGGMTRHLASIRTSKKYYKTKHAVSKALSKVPFLLRFGRRIKSFFKRMVLRYNFFESMGVDYIGPVDGHDIERLETVFEEAKSRNRVVVVHMVTQKGRGYAPAEERPERYHSVSPFSLNEGAKEGDESFSTVFGNLLTEEAKENDKICAITAAMTDGTGLTPFAKAYPDRFFDVGIAEEHAVTFGSGLAKKGFLPVFAVYSTFSQRIYDQLWHDVALQSLPMVLAIDRSGFVSGDGYTHQGIYDVSLFSSIPNTKIYAPTTYEELSECLKKALRGTAISVVRYHKGTECASLPVKEESLSHTEGVEEKKKVVVTYGRVTEEVLKSGSDVGIVKLTELFPLPVERIKELTAGAQRVYLIEEGVLEGGIAQKLSALLDKPCTVRAVSGFMKQASLPDLYRAAKLDRESLKYLLNEEL